MLGASRILPGCQKGDRWCCHEIVVMLVSCKYNVDIIYRYNPLFLFFLNQLFTFAPELLLVEQSHLLVEVSQPFGSLDRPRKDGMTCRCGSLLGDSDSLTLCIVNDHQ